MSAHHLVYPNMWTSVPAKSPLAPASISDPMESEMGCKHQLVTGAVQSTIGVYKAITGGIIDRLLVVLHNRILSKAQIFLVL